MLGPLPAIYRMIVAVCAVLVFIGLGAWLAFTLPIPLQAPVGAGIGAGMGMVAVLGILYDFQDAHSVAHRARARAYRRR